jgi:hypothetical protein
MTSPRKQNSKLANDMSATSNYAALKGDSESSLEVSQLLGPEDGLKVVALEDGVTHGGSSDGCNAFLLMETFQKPNSAKALPPCSRMCGSSKLRIAR